MSEVLDAAMKVFIMLLASRWLLAILFFGMLAYMACCRPRWLRSDSPFFPFKRWTWLTPPANWKSTLAWSVLWMVLFGFGAVWLYHHHGGRASSRMLISGFMALHFAVMSVRIAARVRSLGSAGRMREGNSNGTPGQQSA